MLRSTEVHPKFLGLFLHTLALLGADTHAPLEPSPHVEGSRSDHTQNIDSCSIRTHTHNLTQQTLRKNSNTVCRGAPNNGVSLGLVECGEFVGACATCFPTTQADKCSSDKEQLDVVGTMEGIAAAIANERRRRNQQRCINEERPKKKKKHEKD